MTDKLKLSSWDASEFLECQEDIDAYLDAAYETGDPKLIRKAINNVSKARDIIETSTTIEIRKEHKMA